MTPADRDATRRRERQAPASAPQQVHAPALLPGEVLAGRYEIRGLLGRGGMGTVHEAHDRELDLAVALKVLERPTAGRDVDLRRLKSEVLLARLVSHGNVCRLHDLGRDTERDILFATMELLAGETLADRLARDGPIPPADAMDLVEQVVAGLEAAHRAGVVHRDLKPANVMLVRDGASAATRAVLTDFGIARSVTHEDVRVTAEDMVVGTLAYMAPEQLYGERAGPAADVYALGVVLHEMVTGRLPFPGTVSGAMRKLEEDPPSPREHVPGLPEVWERTILRCLAREPQERFARVSDVTAALQSRLDVTSGVARHRGNLPAARDSFVGRAQDLEEIAALLTGGRRLVTLLGTGGTGKTRLALEHARRTLPDWPGGTWLCDLTDARSREGVLSAVATALDVALGGQDPEAQLAHAIAGRGRCLLILDNAEQVTAPLADLLAGWLDHAEMARFLVTSRERLRLADERALGVETLDDDAAVELFAERARHHRPGYEPAAHEIEAIRTLVARLERLPLAIELAAARMRVMTPRQIAERMTDRFQLLASREPSGRHRALRAAIDVSWEMLDPWEEAAFAQASVFEGGFTLEAAEEVLDLSAFPEAPWTVDVVQALVDKSLLRVEVVEAGDSRFSMFVSLQDYAREKLTLDEKQEAEARHGMHFGAFGNLEALESLDMHGGAEGRRRLAGELDNLLAACRRAVARQDAETAASTSFAACSVLFLRGPFRAAAELAREVLNLTSLSSRACAQLEWLAGWASYSAGSSEEARDHYERALVLARQAGDRPVEGRMLASLGKLHMNQGRMDEALAHFEAALLIAREAGGQLATGRLLGNLARGLHRQGRSGEARTHYEAALVCNREVGDRQCEGYNHLNLGSLSLDEDMLDVARAHFEAALVVAREVGDRMLEAAALMHLGASLSQQRLMDQARALCEESLVITRETGHRHAEATALCYLGELEAAQGRRQEAMGAFAAGEQIFRALTDTFYLAKLLCARGIAEARWGELAGARALLDEAANLAEAIAAGPDSALGRALARLRDALAAAEGGVQTVD